MPEADPVDLAQIEQVVVVMMENRGFDHMLGWLYNGNAPGLRFLPASSPHRFDGLDGVPATNTFGPGFADQKPYPPTKGAANYNVPTPRPHEEFQYVYRQLYSRAIPPDGNGSNPGVPPADQMRGFLADYADKVGYTPANQHDARLRAEALQILECYDQLPIMSMLARNGAVSDAWFSSIPTQTNCNRAFLGAGTSQGMVNNQWIWRFYPVEWDVETVWNKILSANGPSESSWKVYFSEHWAGFYHCFTQDMFKRLYDLPYGDDYFRPIREFFADAHAGTLPKFTFIEPAWYLDGLSPETPNSYHPPSSVKDGEAFLLSLVLAVAGAGGGSEKARQKWQKTLFVLTFDEHGGTYDHVPPPLAIAPGDLGQPPLPPEYRFNFKSLGVRVPTILFSPRILQPTVFRSDKPGVAYDHTSIIASLLDWFGIEKTENGKGRLTWGMGDRTDAAPTFWHALRRLGGEPTTQVEATISTLQKLRDYLGPGDWDPATPLPKLDADFFARGLCYMSRRECVGPLLERTVGDILRRAKTWGDLRTEIHSFREKYGA